VSRQRAAAKFRWSVPSAFSVALLAVGLLQYPLISMPANAQDGSRNVAPNVARKNTSRVDGMAKIREAATALSNGQLTSAINLYTQALQDKRLTNDRKGVILNDRGVVNARLGKPAQAIADFNQAVTLFPEYAAAYNNRGAFLVSLGALKEAIKDLDRALALAPGYVAAWNNRAGVYVKLKQYAAAIQDYTRAIRLAPGLAEPLTGRARIYLLQSRPHAALRDLTRALRNDARYAQGYRVRGEVQLALARFNQAAEDLSRAIAFNPIDVKAYQLRGRAYLLARNTDAALKDFTKVIEIEPRSAEAYRERGNANILSENFELAEQDLTRSLEIDPRGAVTFAYRALMHKKLNQPELGLQEIQKAIHLAPENAIVLWAKGEIEEAQSRDHEAAESYRKALAVDPDLAMAELGLRRLNQDIPSEAITFPNLGRGEWKVVLEKTKFFALNARYPKLRVPLELGGTGQPRILEWQPKDDALKGIGILRFSAGEIQTDKGRVTLEYIALLDVRANLVLALEPHRRGDLTSRWTWHDGKVTVAALDGLTISHTLRNIARLQSDARRRSRSRQYVRRDRARGTPFWAPWADQSRSRPRRKTTYRRKRRQRKKTLFDLLLGN